MALPEFVVPVLSTAGSFSLLCVIVRNFSQVSQALMVVLATVVAIFARDENRRQRGLDILDKLTGRDSDPPGPGQPPRRRAITRRGRSSRLPSRQCHLQESGGLTGGRWAGRGRQDAQRVGQAQAGQLVADAAAFGDRDGSLSDDLAVRPRAADGDLGAVPGVWREPPMNIDPGPGGFAPARLVCHPHAGERH
jgi:hypothetical protein